MLDLDGAGLSTVVVNLQVVFVPALAWLVEREPVRHRYLFVVHRCCSDPNVRST